MRDAIKNKPVAHSLGTAFYAGGDAVYLQVVLVRKLSEFTTMDSDCLEKNPYMHLIQPFLFLNIERVY